MEENTDIESSVSTPEKKEALLKRDCEKRGADEKEPLSASEDDPCLSINNKSETTKDEPDTKHVFFKTFSRNGSNGNTGKKKKTNNDRNSSFVNRLEKRLHTKTGFNRKGLIFVTVIIFLLFAFFIVTVVLASTWPRKSHLELTPVCKKPPCLLASAEILEKRNTRVSPCEDFWTYACGNWLKSNPLPVTRSKWDQEEQLATKYRGELRDLITTLPYPTRTSSVQWKLKYFYESCMSIDSIEADAAGPLRLIINELGGWNVLREFSVLTYDYRDHLTKLHSKYGVSPFFEVVVVPDPENTEKNIVQVRPSGLGLPDRSFYYRRPENAFAWRTSSRICVDVSNMTSVRRFLRRLITSENVELTYKRFLKDAAQILGATSTDAVAFSDEMYHFEKRIAEGTPDIQQLQHPFTYQKVSLAELKMKAASIPLYDIIAHKYPNAKLDDTVEILTSEMYLAHISSILSTTDRGILNNYLVWTLASAYLPYLSKRYQDVVNMYIKEMTGIQQPFERWEMCIETLQKFMGFVLTALHESNINSQAREDNRKAVNEMFETIVESTRGSIRFSEWFGHELKQYMVQKLNVLGLQVGFPGPMMSSTYLEEYYSNLYVQKKNFFQNILFGVSFLQYADERKLTNPVEEYRWMDHLIRSHGVLYVPVANKVVLPQRILRVPYFHHQFPLPVLYGNFGTQLASTIVSSILPWNILHGATGNLISEDDIIINQTLRGIQHTQKFTISNIKKSGGSELIANLTALKTVIEISALKQAHFALQHVMKELPHSHVPAIEELENDALYYLAYAQSLCAESTSQQDDIDILKTSKLKGPLMLKTTLPQMKEFSAAYSCSGQILHNSFPLFT